MGSGDRPGGRVRRYSPKQEAEFRRRFVEKQRFQVAGYVPAVGAVVLVVLAVRYVPDVSEEAGTIFFGTLGLLLASALFTWRNWRCPACGKFLGLGLSPTDCPKCGVTLALRRPQ